MATWKKLSSPINHFLTYTRPPLAIIPATLFQCEVLKAFFIWNSCYSSLVLLPFRVWIQKTVGKSWQKAKHWKWVEVRVKAENERVNLNFQVSMDEFEYHYICCFLVSHSYTRFARSLSFPLRRSSSEEQTENRKRSRRKSSLILF